MYNTIYPGYVRPYQGSYNQIVKRKEDEEESQSSHQSSKQEEQNYSYPTNQFPNGQQVAIDYSQSSVNISQILMDFQNTTSAIGAPDDIAGEVNTYLSLVEAQAQKENPNKQVIQSNLKNASQILDAYIAESLNKPSKVVENWTDALFLQNVDYRANTSAISAHVQEQANHGQSKATQTTETTQAEIVNEQSSSDSFGSSGIQADKQTRSGVYVPEDRQLRKMFIQAKKYSSIGQDDKAIDSFKQTLDYAKDVDDAQAQSMVYYEVGQIYDKNNLLPEAIKSYNKAIEKTEDDNIKARSHIAMGQIYDDVVQFEPAMDHYYAAISYAGETDNLNVQTKALSSIAGMYCNRYDKANMSEYLDLATSMSKETGNYKTIASVYRQSADMSEQLGQNVQALDYYKESTRYYSSTNMTENIVKNYQSAAEIMLNLGDSAKAKTLLQKAFIKAQSVENQELTMAIASKLTQI